MHYDPSMARDEDPEQPWRIHMRPKQPQMIVCLDAGCWSPDQETWQDFLERKGLDPETKLVVD